VRRELTGEEFAAALRDFEHTAFRLETQPTYFAPEEQDFLARLRAGESPSPTDVPALRAWFEQVAEQTRQGKRVERVRVQDEPPTEYQRWERWCDPWNVRAGETMRYMTRRRAHDVGLLPAAGPCDWWLLDSRVLVVMTFDPEGRLTRTELATESSAVTQAAAWRDLAVRHSAPSGQRSAAAWH
jgi:hypothetical protein